MFSLQGYNRRERLYNLLREINPRQTNQEIQPILGRYVPYFMSQFFELMGKIRLRYTEDVKRKIFQLAKGLYNHFPK